MTKLRDQTLALAGVFQTAALVNRLATTGSIDQHDLEACISSTFITDPKSADDVYGHLENLRTGLYTLINQIGESTSQRDINIARYAVSLMHLQKKLAKHKDMLNTIAEGLNRAKHQSEMFGLTHENVLANLASLYSDTVSQIPPRIMVNGESEYLSNPKNADKIRSLFLAGIRSAVLWEQVGGNRWSVLFKRRRFVQEANRLLTEELPSKLH